MEIDAQLRQSAYAALPGVIHQAREDPVIFNDYVLRDEVSGGRIDSVAIHEQMHDALDAYNNVVFICSPAIGKSWQITIGRTAWQIGRDPDRFRGVIASKNKFPNARKFTSAIRSLIEGSREFKEVFPGVRPGRPWTDEAFTVNRDADANLKDFTLEASGSDGSVLGSRYTWACCDDLLDEVNTSTEYQSDKILRWVMKQLYSRMTTRRDDGSGVDGKIAVIVNAWKEYDAAHKLVREYGFKLVRITARDKRGKTKFALQWPQRVIDEYPPAIAKLHLDCVAEGQGQGLFDVSYWEKCKRAGLGLQLLQQLTPEHMQNGNLRVTGVDLASGKKPKGAGRRKNDDVVLFTAELHQDGRIQLLWIEKGQFKAPEILLQIIGHFLRYGSRFLVEDNATQVYITDLLNEPMFREVILRQAAEIWLGHTDVPIELLDRIQVAPFTTDMMKWHPELGIRSIAVEMSQGKWMIPSVEDEHGDFQVDDILESFWHDLQSFDPSAHTPDTFMAAWFCRTGLRDTFFHEVGNLMTDAEFEIWKKAIFREREQGIIKQEPILVTPEEQAEAQDRKLWETLGGVRPPDHIDTEEASEWVKALLE